MLERKGLRLLASTMFCPSGVMHHTLRDLTAKLYLVDDALRNILRGSVLRVMKCIVYLLRMIVCRLASCHASNSAYYLFGMIDRAES